MKFNIYIILLILGIFLATKAAAHLGNQVKAAQAQQLQKIDKQLASIE